VGHRAAAGLCLADSGHAQSAAPRSEVPIREVLIFYGDSGPVAAEQFAVGLSAQASGLSFAAAAGGITTMKVGRSPYFAFDVLYVPGGNRVGVKPRAPGGSGPTGVLLDRRR
jgi:hypothetical protein